MNGPGSIDRRALLERTACGFGAIAFESLRQSQLQAATVPGAPPASNLLVKPPMGVARAKRVIFLFMAGGPSHVDTFDHKPELIRSDGKSIDFVGVRFQTFGVKSQRTLMKPMWPFRRCGESGHHVSSLFPHVANCVDDLCFLHGMHTDGVAHGPCTLFLHTGATNLVRPSLGSWVSYGLGTENQSLPAFITIGAPSANGGSRNYSNAFLPAIHQATTIGRSSRPARDATINHLVHPRLSEPELTRQYDFLRQMNATQLDEFDARQEQNAILESYELAFRMQRTAPNVLDMDRETADTLALYGIDQPATENFGRQCLMARKFAEAGVRYIQVNYANESANPMWDQHAKMQLHKNHALATDKPVAGLLADLKQRGLLEDTLVWWGGEFGRTPFSQSNDGRDHNPRGFTMFLAGAGVKPGFSYGATDDLGHLAVQGRIHMHDMHATLLHLMGLDHKKLTYRYAGRDFRLTDVHGRIVHDILT